jgi:hypothetical protein
MTLRFIKRRKMGLTVGNVVRVLQEMKTNSELAQYVAMGQDGEQSLDVSNLAIGVASKLATDKPGDWQDIDWDAVLEWIEKLLELLVKFLPIIIELFA